MAGKTIEESRSMCQATQGEAKEEKIKQRGAHNSNIKNEIMVKGLDGQIYIVDIKNLQKIQLEMAKTLWAL